MSIITVYGYQFTEQETVISCLLSEQKIIYCPCAYFVNKTLSFIMCSHPEQSIIAYDYLPLHVYFLNTFTF